MENDTVASLGYLPPLSGLAELLQKMIDEIDYSSELENDLVITSGEQVTIGILSMILNKLKIKSLIKKIIHIMISTIYLHHILGHQSTIQNTKIKF